MKSEHNIRLLTPDWGEVISLLEKSVHISDRYGKLYNTECWFLKQFGVCDSRFDTGQKNNYFVGSFHYTIHSIILCI